MSYLPRLILIGTLATAGCEFLPKSNPERGADKSNFDTRVSGDYSNGCASSKIQYRNGVLVTKATPKRIVTQGGEIIVHKK